MKKILEWVAIIVVVACIGVFMLYTYEKLIKNILDVMSTIKK